MDWRDQLSGLKAELPEGENSPEAPKTENTKKQQKNLCVLNLTNATANQLRLSADFLEAMLN